MRLESIIHRSLNGISGVAAMKQRKRVSWAPNASLSQVRLFSSEDSPSLSGSNTQDHLQAKGSHLYEDDSRPPGFNSPVHSATPCLKIEITKIPLTKWRVPPELSLNSDWLVAAGDESEELAVENYRLRGVLEAVYPLESVIPANPSFSVEGQDSRYDEDLRTPVIPITAIEDEDSQEQLDIQSTKSSPAAASGALSVSPVLPCPFSGGSTQAAEPDVVAAATAAFTAIMRSNEAGSLVDPDLLIMILNNPTLIEKLISDNQFDQSPQPATSPPLPPMLLGSPSILTAGKPPSLPPFSGNMSAPTPAPPQQALPPPPVNSQRNSQVKDANYYKSLIEEHGKEKQDDIPKAVFSRQRDTKQPKMVKPCAYFNTPRGCRNGSSCLFLHNTELVPPPPPQPPRSLPIEQPYWGAKRMKFDGGIAGRN